MPKTRPAYPAEFRREAVAMLYAGRTPRELSESLGVSEQTLRNWRRQDQRGRHERDDGPTRDERDDLRRLRRENARLRQERDLLKRAASRGLLRSRGRDPVTLPDDLGGEGQPPPVSVCCRAVRRVALGLLRMGRARPVRSRPERRVAN